MFFEMKIGIYSPSLGASMLPERDTKQKVDTA